MQNLEYNFFKRIESKISKRREKEKCMLEFIQKFKRFKGKKMGDKREGLGNKRTKEVVKKIYKK